MRKYLLHVISIWSLCFLNGCGTSSPPPPPITVGLSPSTALALDVNRSIPITANVSNDSGNQGFDWTLTCGGGNCGTITAHTASGVAATFTAPGAAPSYLSSETTKLTSPAKPAQTEIERAGLVRPETLLFTAFGVPGQVRLIT